MLHYYLNDDVTTGKLNKLTDLDGEYLMTGIRRMVRQEVAA